VSRYPVAAPDPLGMPAMAAMVVAADA